MKTECGCVVMISVLVIKIEIGNPVCLLADHIDIDFLRLSDGYIPSLQPEYKDSMFRSDFKYDVMIHDISMDDITPFYVGSNFERRTDQKDHQKCKVQHDVRNECTQILVEDKIYREQNIPEDLNLCKSVENVKAFELNNGDVTDISIVTPISEVEDNQLMPLSETDLRHLLDSSLDERLSDDDKERYEEDEDNFIPEYISLTHQDDSPFDPTTSPLNMKSVSDHTLNNKEKCEENTLNDDNDHEDT